MTTENLVKVLEEIRVALDQDDPKAALEEVMIKHDIPLPDDKDQLIIENVKMMKGLAEDFVVITCIINQRSDDIPKAMKHVMAVAPIWISDNHQCQSHSDHDQFLAKYLLYVKHQAEVAMGFHKDEL